MDKKAIYEHLAKIYLDASSQQKKKTPKPYKLFQNLLFISILLIFISFIFLSITQFNKSRALNSEIALVLCPDAVKINFHFDPVKKEIYSIDLTKLDLRRFKTLGFSVKKAAHQDNIALRVEFTSKVKEKSGVYFKNIPNRWRDYKINLSEFKDINDWSRILSLSFIVEEWNAKEKRGIVYLDNVRLLR